MILIKFIVLLKKRCVILKIFKIAHHFGCMERLQERKNKGNEEENSWNTVWANMFEYD